MSRTVRLSLVLCTIFFSSVARADFSIHSSVGSAFILSGGADRDRLPVSFDIAPGWDFGRIVRLELPIVFAVASRNVYPPVPNAFMGLRPQAKIFPLDWLYGKAAAQFYFPGGDLGEDDGGVEQDFYFGTTFGVGFEWVFFDFIGVNAEVNFSPLFLPELTMPIELRGGLTLLF